MWGKRKQLIIATAVIGLLAAGAPALDVLAQSASPFGKGNPLDNLQAQVDSLNRQLQALLNSTTPTSLTGDYAVFGNIDCVNYGPEFGPNLSVNLNTNNAAVTQHQTLVGTIHYDGHGNATEVASGMTLSDLSFPNALPISTYTVSCPVTYAVNTDGTFTQSRTSCSAIGTATNGAISTITLTGNVQLQGRIVNGGKMLFLAGITPDVESLTNSVHGNSQRVCTRSSVATKIN